jgi:hypothetical protein
MSGSETSDPGRGSMSDDTAEAKLDDMVDEWGRQSSPASDSELVTHATSDSP